MPVAQAIDPAEPVTGRNACPTVPGKPNIHFLRVRYFSAVGLSSRNVTGREMPSLS